jgi:hypothetical protein
MLEWSTPDHVCDLLQRCEKQGINTWQFSHHERAIKDFAEHRKRGGNLKWILLSHREIEDDHRLIGDVVKQKPIGIVHHGGSAERKRSRTKHGQTSRSFVQSTTTITLPCDDNLYGFGVGKCISVDSRFFRLEQM